MDTSQRTASALRRALRRSSMKVCCGALVLLLPGCLRVGAVAHVRRKAPLREKKAYDTSVRAFSPDGSIYQVEYAVQAAEKGGLTIGVQTDRGLVLAAQGRRRSPLLKSSSVCKIVDIDVRMFCAMSGLLPDGRLLVDHARTWVQEHRFEFDEAPSVEAVAAQLSRLALKFNGYDAPGEQGEGGNQGGLAMSRPVGVALLMAGIDCGGRPVLYHLDPTGAYVQWRARAIGEKSSAAEVKLEKAGPYEGMTVRRAMATVLGVLKDVLGDDFCVDRLEMVCVDNMTREDDDEEEVAGTIQGEGRLHPRDTSRSADVKSRDTTATSSQDRSSRILSSSSSSSGNSNGGAGASDRGSDRESSGTEEGAGGLSRAKDGSPGAASMPRQYGLFRRVSKSEMEKLLVEELSATQNPAE